MEKAQDKTLEILIVEDNEKHLADAKVSVEAKIKEGYQINADYSSTFVDAEKKMMEKKYDGIITDIFFPYDSEVRGTAVSGWHPEAKDKIVEILGIEGYVKRCSSDEIKREIEYWRAGTKMHPTGIMVSEEAKKQKIPFVFCTDTYHHGHATQPIFSYARWSMVDCHDAGYSGHTGTKKWGEALEIVLRQVKQ